ncbi:MAG: hypothetical protein BWX88_01534 [Planctomycetes bacterium ADurb.Bin126]|nr:MAG: hypothetical protein BWX88_01534 [Planctomycetes bacterium ADurb.Bin126]
MTEQDRPHDESLVIDFVLGRCDEQARRQAEERSERDAEFRNLCRSVSNTLRVLDLAVEHEPPGDLAARTLRRIEQARRTDALLAREELARRRFRPTFSFREIASVAAALLLMAGIFVPSARQARIKSRIGLCASNAGQIGSAIHSYASAHEGALPSVTAPQARWLPGDGGQSVSNSASLFRLIRSDYTSPMIFQCPGCDRAAATSFVVDASMCDFPGPRFITYSYQHALGQAPSRRDLRDLAVGMAILADETPVFNGVRFLRDRVRASASDNHAQRGQNVLYLDMHVDWRRQAAAGIDGDNIFLARDVYDYTGQEKPADSTDSFLLPAYSGSACLR